MVVHRNNNLKNSFFSCLLMKNAYTFHFFQLYKKNLMNIFSSLQQQKKSTKFYVIVFPRTKSRSNVRVNVLARTNENDFVFYLLGYIKV